MPIFFFFSLYPENAGDVRDGISYLEKFFRRGVLLFLRFIIAFFFKVICKTDVLHVRFISLYVDYYKLQVLIKYDIAYQRY